MVMIKRSLIFSLLMLLVMMESCTCKSKDGQAPVSGAIENILARKSVRNYLDKAVEEEKITTLLRAGMAAPSGKDQRPWEFIVVKDRMALDSMAEALPYAKMLKNAQQAIVVCGDSTKSSYWYLDCSAATQNILLAAEALGLGAVWTAAYPYQDRIDIVKKYTAMPDHIIPLCVIPVGYPAKEQMPKDKFDPSKIHTDKF